MRICGTSYNSSHFLILVHALFTNSTCSLSFDSNKYIIASHLFSKELFLKRLSFCICSSEISLSIRYFVLYLSFCLGSLSFIALTTDLPSYWVFSISSLLSSFEAPTNVSKNEVLPEPDAPITRH